MGDGMKRAIAAAKASRVDPERARAFAMGAHGDQMYGELPHLFHLDAVHGVLVEFGYNDKELLCAAFLHDVLEDTGAKRSDLIKRWFTPKIALLVARVTDQPGANRKERKAKTYPVIAQDPCAVILKLADRIANVRQCREGAPRHKDYYDRGIKICDRWDDFANFLADMGPRPSTLHSIERRNNDGNYEPPNCYWATFGQQRRNNRRIVNITLAGRTMCAEDWAKETGLKASTIRRRKELGWPDEDAVTTPAVPYQKVFPKSRRVPQGGAR